ncbi:MAG TPA: class I SAM-dependent methyltransferase [Pyrinomonadaceae bacterium]|nr:class I SAM-dependent methyltransferase [Chloracidobacterium sp.]HRJ88827.1 class I SAM-dependent methyltransferase [Pyrinomonadaceae bacterium]HRK48900.1 class I SAM-dependent methyltransferase [Pyrinomonadaceae bacterium]
MTIVSNDAEIVDGLLYCKDKHYFPIVRGIPRMLPSSLEDHWAEIKTKVGDEMSEELALYLDDKAGARTRKSYDTRTKVNFSNEWDSHEIGGKTWTMELKDRVQWYFLDSIRIDKDDLSGKLMLDAGCGNGSQSVAYSEFGLEVLALDLSTGLEKGYAFINVYANGKPENVHFVQADLQNPPLAPDLFDIIHSAGVLHHTPNTEKTFRALCPLLKKGGTFYVWLYKYEKLVTPIVDSMRIATTRIPAPIFAALAEIASLPFIAFCWTVNKLRIRQYETPNQHEAAIAVHDIFGAPYAHYHDFNEVADWYTSEGFDEIWECNDGRRGFGVCGRMSTTEST